MENNCEWLRPINKNDSSVIKEGLKNNDEQSVNSAGRII